MSLARLRDLIQDQYTESVVFLCTSNEQSKSEIKETIQFIISKWIK